MTEDKSKIIILIADDDKDDRLMIKEAMEDAGLTNPIHFVEDGEQFLDYLKRRGKYKELSSVPYPGLILLDLNMPKKDGREALQEMKNDPELRRIPVVIFTTSNADRDVLTTYNLGANSYITKPVTFDSLVAAMKILSQYWFDIVELPDYHK